MPNYSLEYKLAKEAGDQVGMQRALERQQASQSGQSVPKYTSNNDIGRSDWTYNDVKSERDNYINTVSSKPSYSSSSLSSSSSSSPYEDIGRSDWTYDDVKSNYDSYLSNTKSYGNNVGVSNQKNNLVTNFSPTSGGGYNTYVVLPNGSRVSATVNNGVTTLSDGSRPPIGSTVSTKDGFYTLGEDGSSRSTYGNLVGGYLGAQNFKNAGEFNKGNQKLVSDFFYDNPDILKYLKDNNAEYDTGVSFDIVMNDGVYAGELPGLRDRFIDWYSRADANAVRGSNVSAPTTSNKQRAISSAIGRYDGGSSSFNYRPEGTVSSFDSYDVPVYSDFPTSRTSTVPQNSNNVIVLNPNNPQAGTIYETSNGRFLDINGQRVKLSDDEYINMMAKYLGF